MRWRYLILLLLVILSTSLIAANEKKKIVLPAVVLKAQSVAVLTDPDAGISPSAPLENKTAQEDVEKALAKWGRFRAVMSSMNPDLVIVIRKGNGKMVQPTIGGTSPNNRPVILQPNDNGIRIGGQKGQSPDGTQSDPQSSSPQPQVGIGASEDSFVVYDGTASDPMDRASLAVRCKEWTSFARSTCRGRVSKTDRRSRKTAAETATEETVARFSADFARGKNYFFLL